MLACTYQFMTLWFVVVHSINWCELSEPCGIHVNPRLQAILYLCTVVQSARKLSFYHSRAMSLGVRRSNILVLGNEGRSAGISADVGFGAALGVEPGLWNEGFLLRKWYWGSRCCARSECPDGLRGFLSLQ